MAKELPYFKFETSRWLLGGIMDYDLESQAVFINTCAMYWEKSGQLSLSDIDRKNWFKATAFNSLTDRLLSVKDGIISIKFLDEQLSERRHKSELNAKNGKLGGASKHKVLKVVGKRSVSENKRPDRQLEEKRREENNTNTDVLVTHPLIEWLKKECPQVCKMQSPITVDQAVKILSDFTDRKIIEKTFLSMQNRKTLLKDYTSANLTFRNWISREKGSSNGGPKPLPPGMA